MTGVPERQVRKASYCDSK